MKPPKLNGFLGPTPDLKREKDIYCSIVITKEELDSYKPGDFFAMLEQKYREEAAEAKRRLNQLLFGGSPDFEEKCREAKWR